MNKQILYEEKGSFIRSSFLP